MREAGRGAGEAMRCGFERDWRGGSAFASRSAMSALDIFVILLLGGGALIGFVRGFVHEVLSLLAWIAAIAMLKLLHGQLSTGLTDAVGTHAGAAVLAFALLFVPTFILVKLLARSLGGRTRRSLLGPIDRVLGAGFGMLKGLIGATLFFLLANLATDLIYGPEAERPAWMTESRTYPLLNASGRSIVDWVEARRTLEVA
jgi:membrane protein required for colicin V production